MGEKMTLEQVRDSLLSVYERDRNGTGGDQYRSAWAKQLADALDAHLATPAQTVDVEAVREVILQLRAYQNLSDKWPQEFSDMELDAEADKLSQAIGDKT